MLLLVLAPYSVLLLQVLGFVAVAALIARRVGVSLAVATAGAVAVVMVVQAVPRLWTDFDAADGVRSHLAVPHGLTERERCFADASALTGVPVVRWIRTVIPPGQTYALEGPIDPGCVAFNLLPRRPAAPGVAPRWVVLWGSVPARYRRLAHARGSRRRVWLYGSAFAVVRSS